MNSLRNRKIRRETLLIWGIPLMILMLIWVTLMVVNPIRRPRFMVRNHVLRLTPMGTHIDDVAEILENHKNWNIGHINHERGFTPPRSTERSPIGEMSIRVWAGEYWPSNAPFIGFMVMTSVSIFWGFDADGLLIDVYISKSMGW